MTNFAVEERFGEAATCLRARLETGRTHQIRLHLEALGHPVLGDRQHGVRTPFDPPRLALHAARLAFAHPRSKEPLSFESPWPPDDLRAWLASLRQQNAVPAGGS